MWYNISEDKEEQIISYLTNNIITTTKIIKQKERFIMRTECVMYNVYKYNELSEDAKEKVKQWYLNGQEPDFFADDCEMDLENLFGKNDLKVQFSLASCQGDGFNIYGKIDAESILKCLESHNGGTQLEKFENVLTEKEKKTILHYATECGDIELPMNSRYCYSLADYIDIADDWETTLVYADYRDINVKVLKKFEEMVRDIFRTLCRSYEKWGYEFFYEIADDDLDEICEANGYEFLEDGTMFL